MKIVIFVLAILIAAPVSVPAQTSEELVQAAREARKKRKQPSTKPLTNKDVKNSKGKLIELPGPAATPETEKKPEGPTPLEQHDARYRERLALEEQLAAATAAVAALEKQLESLESRYYEENDPDRRDKVIRKEFEETQKKLEIASEELRSLVPESGEPNTEITETQP